MLDNWQCHFFFCNIHTWWWTDTNETVLFQFFWQYQAVYFCLHLKHLSATNCLLSSKIYRYITVQDLSYKYGLYYLLGRFFLFIWDHNPFSSKIFDSTQLYLTVPKWSLLNIWQLYIFCSWCALRIVAVYFSCLHEMIMALQRCKSVWPLLLNVQSVSLVTWVIGDFCQRPNDK